MIGTIIFRVLGVDRAMRVGRVSGRRCVLWLDGARRNEAHHGASTPFCTRDTSFIISCAQGIDPIIFFGGATLGCMGMCRYSSCRFSCSQSFLVFRYRISHWPHNWFNALARNAPAHHGAHRGTRPRVPPAYCQKPRRPQSTERYKSSSGFLW